MYRSCGTRNLHLVHLESGEERPLTTDGGGDIINGTTDWVYEEELSFFDGYRWSPDGTPHRLLEVRSEPDSTVLPDR